ncbi:hypothetical protein SLE2022_146770 [Rubroshorea leprosula]
MANSGSKKGAYDEMYDKILDLRGLMETTRKNIVKLMEDSLKEGMEDDPEDIAANEHEKFEDFHRRFRAFERDCVNLVRNPSELDSYHKRFQEFSQELNKIDKQVREYLQLIEDIEEEAEEQNQSPIHLETKELQASSDAAGHTMFGNLEGKILPQSDMQAMEKFYDKKHGEKPPSLPKNPTPKLSPEAAAEVSTEGKKKMEVFNLLPIGTNWNLCTVIMHMYGFERTESQKIEMYIDKAFIRNPYHGIGSSEGRRILDWRSVSKAKEVLQESKAKIQRLQNMIPGLFKIWLLRVENQMYSLVLYLRCIMSGYEPAMAKFQELRTSLEICRQRNIGRVPIVAHRILKLLEMQVPEEQSELNRDQQEALYRDCGFDQVIGSIQKMILLCKSLLMVSRGASHATRISAYELERSEQLLRKAEEELNGMERRLMKARKNVQKKRRREDEDGGNESRTGTVTRTANGSGSGTEDGGNGSGTGGLEM